jgi:hypothetical protein
MCRGRGGWHQLAQFSLPRRGQAGLISSIHFVAVLTVLGRIPMTHSATTN